MTLAGPTGMPAPRSTRTKCSDVLGEATARQRRHRAAEGHSRGAGARLTPAGSSRPSLRFGDEPRGDLGTERADVVLVLEQHAQRVGDRLRIERDAVERDQRLGPVERLGDARRLEEVHRAQPLREGDDLARERLGRLRALAPDDLELARARRDSRPSDRGSDA